MLLNNMNILHVAHLDHVRPHTEQLSTHTTGLLHSETACSWLTSSMTDSWERLLSKPNPRLSGGDWESGWTLWNVISDQT